MSYAAPAVSGLATKPDRVAHGFLGGRAARLRDMDTTPTSRSSDRPLTSQIDALIATQEAAISTIKREAAAYGTRRADVDGSRDNKVYRLGQVLEVMDGIDLDPLALQGLLDTRTPYLTWLVNAGRPGERLDFAERARRVLADPDKLDWCRTLGASIQWRRLRALYQAQVAEFARIDAAMPAKDRARWRSRSITREQRYMIAQIYGLTGEPPPALRNRGEAAAFIASAGGNPRFLVEPPAPPALKEIRP